MNKLVAILLLFGFVSIASSSNQKGETAHPVYKHTLTYE